MEYALNKFKNKIEFVRNQLYSQKLANDLRILIKSKGLSKEENDILDSILSNRTDEKVYQYTANIISLYGALESFVETIVDEYLKALSLLFPSYDALKNTTGIDDYMIFATSLLSHAEGHKFKNLAKKDVLKGMYEVLINDKSSVLHSEAFIDVGGGNYKHEIIMKCFRNMGVRDISSKLKKFEPLHGYIQEKGIDTSSNIYAKVDDLVERRNELAHGADSPELIDSDRFFELLSFFQIYAETMNNYLDNELKRYEWESLERGAIEPRVYRDNIIELNGELVEVGTTFAKGQKLYILRDGKYYYGEIDNVQVDKVAFESYTKEEPETVIGLKIRSTCELTKTCKIKFRSTGQYSNQ